jgi:hypothetical protein
MQGIKSIAYKLQKLKSNTHGLQIRASRRRKCNLRLARGEQIYKARQMPGFIKNKPENTMITIE